jgi:Fels-1 Prophage Protein-like
MRPAPPHSFRLAAAALAAALAVLAVPVPEALAGSGRARVDPSFPPLGTTPNPGWSGTGPGGGTFAAPRRQAVPRGYGPDDRRYEPYYGRGSGYSYGGRGYGYQAPLGSRPPGWADDLPYRAQEPGRFVRTRPGVVCDRSTSLCYRRGEVDKTETRDAFGERAADRADDLRDDRGTARLFVPERGVTCDAGRRVCYDDGRPDFSLTRRYFGQRAAGDID